MTGRRQFLKQTVLGGMIIMTVPGAGGQQERPFNAPAGQATPVGIQPGTQADITFARAVVVFGPTGAVNGVFVYQPGTRPAAGNGPVLSGTESTKDLYSNPTQTGWTAYASPGSSAWASLLAAALQLNAAGSVSPGLVFAGSAGGVTIDSGTTGAGDSQAGIVALSVNASGVGGRLVSLVSDQTQLTGHASANLPLAHLSQFPISGAATLAQVITAVNALYAALVPAQVFAS